MTTPTSASTNKTALRASLKKEDESLAERLVVADIPLVATPEPEAPVVAPVAAPASPPPLAAAPARKAAAKPAGAKPATAKPTSAKPAVAKPAADVVPTPAAKAPAKAVKKVAAATVATAKAAEPVAAAKAKPVSRKAAATAKPAAAKPAKPTKPVKVATKDSAAAAPATATATKDAGKKAAKLEATVANIEKAAKEKGDRIVRYTVELLKSEEAAIESVRAELAKAAGWAASKSDILRAGVRVFAEQRIEQMKELLGALATLSKGKKKG